MRRVGKRVVLSRLAEQSREGWIEVRTAYLIPTNALAVDGQRTGIVTKEGKVQNARNNVAVFVAEING